MSGRLFTTPLGEVPRNVKFKHVTNGGSRFGSLAVLGTVLGLAAGGAAYAVGEKVLDLQNQSEVKVLATLEAPCGEKAQDFFARLPNQLQAGFDVQYNNSGKLDRNEIGDIANSKNSKGRFQAPIEGMNNIQLVDGKYELHPGILPDPNFKCKEQECVTLIDKSEISRSTTQGTEQNEFDFKYILPTPEGVAGYDANLNARLIMKPDRNGVYQISDIPVPNTQGEVVMNALRAESQGYQNLAQTRSEMAHILQQRLGLLSTVDSLKELRSGLEGLVIKDDKKCLDSFECIEEGEFMRVLANTVVRETHNELKYGTTENFNKDSTVQTEFFANASRTLTGYLLPFNRLTHANTNGTGLELNKKYKKQRGAILEECEDEMKTNTQALTCLDNRLGVHYTNTVTLGAKK